MKQNNSALCSVEHFPENVWGDAYKSNSHCLFNIFNDMVTFLRSSPLYETSNWIITRCQVEDSRWPVQWSGQHWWPTTIATLPENLTKVLPNSQCIMCWLTALLLDQDFNTVTVQLRYEPVWRDVQKSVPIERIIKEVRPNSLLPHRLTAYFEVWNFMFQFLKIMWILPGPEHIAAWSTALVYGTFINKDDY